MTHSEEQNIVEIWLRKDPVRWLAGAIAGLFSGMVALGVGMLLSVIFRGDLWAPVKVFALPFLGAEALSQGMGPGVIVGLICCSVLTIILGVAFAHFTGTNSLLPLLGVGLTWGAFSWIFINNLFSKSFHEVKIAEISAGAAFFFCVVFGMALASVAFFDRAFRGRR